MLTTGCSAVPRAQKCLPLWYCPAAVYSSTPAEVLPRANARCTLAVTSKTTGTPGRHVRVASNCAAGHVASIGRTVVRAMFSTATGAPSHVGTVNACTVSHTWITVSPVPSAA